MNHLGCTVEVRTAWGVVAHSSALNALFVLLVTLLPSTLVLLYKLDVAQGQRIQILIHEQVAVGQVLVEVLVLHRPLGVQGDHHGAVRKFLKLRVEQVRHVNDLGHLLVTGFLVLIGVAVNEAVELWVYWELRGHVCSLISRGSRTTCLL